MTGSPIFSINLTNRKNPSNLNNHMSIKKSQATLKRFINLKFSVWFTLGSSLRSMTVLAGEGRETARRLGREQLEKPPARTGGFLDSVRTPAYGSFRLVRNVRLSIKYFGNLPWESFEGLNKSSAQNKIKISKKR